MLPMHICARNAMLPGMQMTAESPLIPAIRIPHINAANARELAARSHEARRRKAELLRALADEQPQPQQPPQDDQQEVALAREHLAMVNARLKSAKDPLDIERLTRARGNLLEQIRVGLDKPLPGMRRPGPPARPVTQDVNPL